MQEGMRIKSKDIHFELYIFYLNMVISLILKLKELEVSQRQAHDDLVNSDFLMLTS